MQPHTHMHIHTQMHAHTQHTHTHTPVAYQGNETEEKVFKKRKIFKEDLKLALETSHKHTNKDLSRLL